MGSEAGEPAPGGVDEDMRIDALNVLLDAQAWRLAPERWSAVRAAVADLNGAVARGDSDAIRDAVTELELLGPVRAKRLGADPTTTLADEVRDEINELVHTLDGSKPPSTA